MWPPHCHCHCVSLIFLRTVLKARCLGVIRFSSHDNDNLMIIMKIMKFSRNSQGYNLTAVRIQFKVTRSGRELDERLRYMW